MENITNKTVPDAKIKIITSKNSSELAKKWKKLQLILWKLMTNYIRI